MKPLIRYLPLFLFPVVSQPADIYCEARLNDRLAVGIRLDDRLSVDPEKGSNWPHQYMVYWDNFNLCETTKDGTMCTQTGVGGEVVNFRAKKTDDGLVLIPLATVTYDQNNDSPAPGNFVNFLDWRIGRRMKILVNDTGVKLVRGSKTVDMECEAD